LTLVVSAGVTLLFVIVAFPNAHTVIADQTSVNRATLQFAPLAVVFVVLAFRAFADRPGRRSPDCGWPDTWTPAFAC